MAARLEAEDDTRLCGCGLNFQSKDPCRHYCSTCVYHRSFWGHRKCDVCGHENPYVAFRDKPWGGAYNYDCEGNAKPLPMAKSPPAAKALIRDPDQFQHLIGQVKIGKSTMTAKQVKDTVKDNLASSSNSAYSREAHFREHFERYTS